MRYSYYPGCTLKTKAKVFEDSTLKTAKALDVELGELDEWQCCGAVFPLASDELVSLLSPVRSLAAARDRGEKLVTLCAACHHVLKRANEVMRTNKEVREKVTGYLELDYKGEAEVIHYLELLRDDIGFEALSGKIKEKLEGRKVAPYYGCLLLRPQKVMQFDNPENPRILEDLIEALGATVVDYPYKTECCGAYLSITQEEVATGTVGRVIASATRNGAEELVVACPLCKYNLEHEQKRNINQDKHIPVYYFTELLEEALGLKVKA